MLNETETSRLKAIFAGDSEQFKNLTEPYRHELLVHCYRMMGSSLDAEDMVQETMLRAWRRLDSFKTHVSFRAWLYKIATNVSLDALDKQKRRSLPPLSYPAADPTAPITLTAGDPIWLEPMPGGWLSDGGANPEARYSSQESATLAFVVALQCLPPRQRAVLILRDVLDYRAREAAQTLELTLSAVNSLLHRARANLKQQHTHGEAEMSSVDDESTQTLLNQYMVAWETADTSTLVSLLKEEATLAMPPVSAWFEGRAAIGQFLSTAIFAQATPGWLRLQSVRANGQPAVAAYRWDEALNGYAAESIHVLTVNGRLPQITNITTFLNPSLFPLFGLPAKLL
ncbi:MAG: sigma-70 family RNA polymerase sigma factor [Chloroflexi bacterium]|nr:sigma-70 family RNA polymerase sigma factor [Chloroflexota bacterium]